MNSVDAARERVGDDGVVLVADEHDATVFVAAAADRLTPATLEELSELGGGRVILALEAQIADRLRLGDPGQEPLRRAALPFVAPIDAARGIRGGWSATDRALTMRVAAAPETVPEDLAIPGHVHPVRIRRADLAAGGGAAEAALELVAAAGRREAVALCAIVDRHGAPVPLSTARDDPRLRELPLASTAALRAAVEAQRAEALAVSCALPARYGEFRAVAHAGTDSAVTLAMVHGDIPPGARIRVHAHTACLLGDTFGSLLCDCGRELDRALESIVAEGAGVVLYTKPTTAPPTQCGREVSADISAAAGLLRHIGVRALRLRGGTAGLGPALRNLGLDVEQEDADFVRAAA
ncbi:MAG: 3,4-dihydroxy-2-butanone 4-phosphate synthase [Solirubrobacterales bacterium]|nr:3,4-dihydroxy-2-butanone 4-phosphate synthase [Solirubrobacterales bacterium]